MLGFYKYFLLISKKGEFHASNAGKVTFIKLLLNIKKPKT